MSRSVRVFVAIEMPQEIREALNGMVERLRQARIRGIRVVDPDRIHLTLKFLGHVGIDRVEAIVDRVTHVIAAYRPFAVELGGIEGFPAGGAPRVFWVGIEGAKSPLLVLQREMDRGLGELGFKKERREFKAHLTLARARETATSADRWNAERTLAAGWFRSRLPIPVDAVSLMRSILLPDGAKYERLAHVKLYRGG